MGFFDFLNSVVGAITPPIMNDPPSCSKCLNCKARIKTLPSGKQVRVFTCPYTGEYDSFTMLPALNPSDPESITSYAEEYKKNLNDLYGYMYDSTEKPGGLSPLKDNDYKPILNYETLKYPINSLYNCGHFKPCLNINNSGDYYMAYNEMLYGSSIGDNYFENLSEEDQRSLVDL